MYFITPIPPTARGHDAIFVVLDRFTKVMRLTSLPKQRFAASVAELYYANVYSHHGFPSEIISVRDPSFMPNSRRPYSTGLKLRLSPPQRTTPILTAKQNA